MVNDAVNDTWPTWNRGVSGSKADVLIIDDPIKDDVSPEKRRACHKAMVSSIAKGKAKGKTKKKCTKCGVTQDIKQFGKHDSSADGHGSICNGCKNIANKWRRENSPPMRIKHHIVTRVIKQYDPAPQNPSVNLESWLGYKISALCSYLAKELHDREGITLVESFKRGYHLDHIHPFHTYKTEKPGDKVFRECWAMSNLRMIPAEENLAKGAKIQ